MTRALAILALFALGACGTTPAGAPAIRTVSVAVPTPVSCVPADLPAPPDYPDELAALKATDGPGRYSRLAAGWALRRGRLELLESIVDACRKAAP